MAPEKRKADRTPEFRGSFVNVFEPRAIQGGKLKYGLTMALPKEHPYWDKLRVLIDEAAVRKFGKVPRGLQSPINDGDEPGKKSGEVRPEWKGCFTVKIESLSKPGVIDADNEDIEDPSEVYSGAYFKASFRAFGWDHPTGGKGVSLGLDNVKKKRDGEAYSGKASAADDFADDVREDGDPDGDGPDDDPMA